MSRDTTQGKRWIDFILTLPQNKYLVRVDDEFLKNNFSPYESFYKNSADFQSVIHLIQFGTPEEGTSNQKIAKSAYKIYGLVHSKYISTESGLRLMHEKYEAKTFTKCPRAYCKGFMCLPYGMSEKYGEKSISMFCPSCSDAYICNEPDCSNLDSSFFGPTWVYKFIKQYPEIIPTSPVRCYVPKIFGFQLIHESDVPTYEEEEEEGILIISSKSSSHSESFPNTSNSSSSSNETDDSKSSSN